MLNLKSLFVFATSECCKLKIVCDVSCRLLTVTFLLLLNLG